jgi:hypothetical protein
MDPVKALAEHISTQQYAAMHALTSLMLSLEKQPGIDAAKLRKDALNYMPSGLESADATDLENLLARRVFEWREAISSAYHSVPGDAQV